MSDLQIGLSELAMGALTFVGIGGIVSALTYAHAQGRLKKAVEDGERQLERVAQSLNEMNDNMTKLLTLVVGPAGTGGIVADVRDVRERISGMENKLTAHSLRLQNLEARPMREDA